jgi:hypothetical protein
MFDTSIQLTMHHSYQDVMHMTLHGDHTASKLFPTHICICTQYVVFTLLMSQHSYFKWLATVLSQSNAQFLIA